MVKFSLISRSRNGRMMNSFRNLQTCPRKHRGNVWKHLLTGIKTSSLQSTWYFKGKLVFFLCNKRDEPVENGRVWSSGLFITSAAQSIPGSFHEVSALLASLLLGFLMFAKGTFVLLCSPMEGSARAHQLLPGPGSTVILSLSGIDCRQGCWQEGQPGGASPFSQVPVTGEGQRPSHGKPGCAPWRANPSGTTLQSGWANGHSQRPLQPYADLFYPIGPSPLLCPHTLIPLVPVFCPTPAFPI